MVNRFDDRFTEQARKVLIRAQEEAMRLQHNYPSTSSGHRIGTEHLLIGLAQGWGVAARALVDFGVTPTQIRKRIEETVGRGQWAELGRTTGLTPRTKRVIELAVEEARRMGHRWIGSEYLLLGLIREGDGVAIALLRDMGVDLDALRTQISQKISAGPRDQAALTCTECDKPLRASWRFCPFCGAPAPGRCAHCHEPLPDAQDAQFCPHCGNQV